MKTVNLLRDIINMKYIHTLYMDVPQPMYVYDSRAEFKEHHKDLVDKVKIVSTYGGFVDFLAQYDVPVSDWGGWDITKETGKLLYINTKEKYVPLKVNKYGGIIYKKEGERLVETDGVFIRVYKVVRQAYAFTIFTSSGMWQLSQNNFTVSGGIKVQYKLVQAYASNPYHGLSYEEKLKKLTERKKATSRDYRLMNYLFNPQSRMYLFGTQDPMRAIYEAVKLAYPGLVRKKDAPKMVFNKRFSQIFMKELGRMIPEFREMLKEHFDGKTIATMLDKTFEKALDDNATVDDARNVIKDIITLAHGDEMMGHESEVPLIGDEAQPKKAIPQKTKIEEFDMSAFEASDVPIPADMKAKESKSAKSDAKPLSGEVFDELRKDTDSISDYVQFTDTNDKNVK